MAPTFSASGSAATAHPFHSLSLESGSAVIPCDAWLYIQNVLRLSDAELQVVQGIFSDEEQDSIALSLGVPPTSVYRMLQRIYIKLRIGSRAELIVRVMSEYLAFVADQLQPEFYAASYWAD